MGAVSSQSETFLQTEDNTSAVMDLCPRSSEFKWDEQLSGRDYISLIWRKWTLICRTCLLLKHFRVWASKRRTRLRDSSFLTQFACEHIAAAIWFPPKARCSRCERKMVTRVRRRPSRANRCSFSSSPRALHLCAHNKGTFIWSYLWVHLDARRSF